MSPALASTVRTAAVVSPASAPRLARPANGPFLARWHRLSALLDLLLDEPPERRPAVLAALGRGQPSVAAELAAALADGTTPDEELLQRHGDVAAGLPAWRLAGQRVGPYMLEGLLGEGGTGSVWRARHEQGRFAGRVALKLPHASRGDASQARRFRHEATVLRRLCHPAVARLLDEGLDEAGQPYLAMERVDGRRLDHYIDVLRPGPRDALAMFGQVLDVVAHLHTHGVVHGDLKPRNLMVDVRGRVTLLDFGAARALDGTALPDLGVACTPGYAAPEQLRGDPPTRASDVFALGVLLQEVLGACPPPQAAAGVCEALERVVGRAVQATPAQRPADAAALAEDLRRASRRLGPRGGTRRR